MLLRKVRKEESPLLFMYRTVTLLRVVSVVHGRLAMPSIDGRPTNMSLKNFAKSHYLKEILLTVNPSNYEPKF